MEINFNGRNYYNQSNTNAKNLNTEKNNQKIIQSSKVYETANDGFVRNKDKDTNINDTDITALYKQNQGSKKGKTSWFSKLISGVVKVGTGALLFGIVGGPAAIGAGALFGGIQGLCGFFMQKDD